MRLTQDTIERFSDPSYDSFLFDGDYPAREEYVKPRRLVPILKGVGAVAAAAAIAFPFGKAMLHENDYEQATEACVSTLVGHKVNLVPGMHEPLQHPRAVISEQLACERNGNDPVAASQDINPVPLS